MQAYKGFFPISFSAHILKAFLHLMSKTDGAGGKGTWGKLLETDGESHIDRNDPNYDSGEVSPTKAILAACDKITSDLLYCILRF